MLHGKNVNGNALIGQSGGPTAAINATLSGVIKGLRDCENIKNIYGARNGIEGVLDERFVDLGSVVESESDHFALECTPSAALGSCRKKLPTDYNDPIYKQIFDVFGRYDIKYFYLIGGNDSMDTVAKLSAAALEHNYNIFINGVPKTIDNDLEDTDHTPGYGSAAKFIATEIEEIARDCAVYTVKAVTVVEIMGRDAGWLTGAAALPKYFGLVGADLVYLPEVSFDCDEFIEDLKKLLEVKPNIVVAVSEGLRDKDGKYVGESSQTGVTDIFGHKYLAGTAKYLETLIRHEIGCKCRSIELSLPQRCSGHCLSKTDIKESVYVGSLAAKHGAEGNTGDFAVFIRESTEPYFVKVGFVPVSEVANKMKLVPREYINERGNNVTDEFCRMIAPLIEGEIAVPMKNGLPIHFTV